MHGRHAAFVSAFSLSVGNRRDFATLAAIKFFMPRLFLARDRLPADVAAAKAFRPFYFVDRGVSAALRLAHAFAARADIEHAAAVRDNVILSLIHISEP